MDVHHHFAMQIMEICLQTKSWNLGIRLLPTWPKTGYFVVPKYISVLEHPSCVSEHILLDSSKFCARLGGLLEG